VIYTKRKKRKLLYRKRKVNDFVVKNICVFHFFLFYFTLIRKSMRAICVSCKIVIRARLVEGIFIDSFLFFKFLCIGMKRHQLDEETEFEDERQKHSETSLNIFTRTKYFFSVFSSEQINLINCQIYESTQHFII
jgi:hypothetical protein